MRGYIYKLGVKPKKFDFVKGKEFEKFKELIGCENIRFIPIKKIKGVDAVLMACFDIDGEYKELKPSCYVPIIARYIYGDCILTAMDSNGEIVTVPDGIDRNNMYIFPTVEVDKV